MSTSLQAEELFRDIRRIEIRTRRIVNDLFSGAYHSTFKGQGMEFEEVRQYEPGDDVRMIDWNVTARTGYPHIKKYKEERELSVVLVVDVSSSGRLGTFGRSKQDIAARLCAVLAFSAIKNNDKVGLIVFSDRIEKFIPPKKGRAHALRLIREILTPMPQGRGTDIGQALEYLAKVIRRKSVVFLVSDFLGDNFDKPLQIANNKHDVIAVNITDPRELDIGSLGILTLEDAETGEIIEIDTSSTFFRREFAARAREDLQQLRTKFQKYSLDSIDITPTEDETRLLDPLVDFFQRRAKRM